MIGLWLARATWAVLPITSGAALADAIDSWSPAPALVATVFAWTSWAVGLFALFAPRPWGLTALRIVAPCVVVATALTLTSTSAASASIAITSSVVACGFALSGPVALATGNALAYGDEHRFLLRIPTPLLLGPVPIAVLVAGAGVVAGPIALAAGSVLVGIVLCAVGLPLAFVLTRSLHSLSRRWLVFVPAGIAIVDQLTMVDAVLIKRAVITRLGRAPRSALGDRALDLRLGTVTGGITIELAEPVTFARRRGRADAELIEPLVVAVAAIRADTALAMASKRRINTA